MATKETGVNVFNYVRNSASATFQDIVPTATSTNIAQLANILFDSTYEPQLNEFVNTLINRIGLTMVRNKIFSNPLSILKKGSVPLGTDIQELYTNPAEGHDYEFSNSAMASLLTITDPDTHAVYYRRNRKDKYTVTVSREGLQGAFVSWEKFEEYISSLTNSLYSGDYIDEFKYTKQLIDGAYDNNKAIIEVVSAPVDAATDKAFVKKCKALYSKMKFPSNKYNAYSKMTQSGKSVTTWTDESRIVLLLNADVVSEIDVEVLAAAFNIDKANFMGRVIEVDGFENEEILGVICDESFFQIYSNMFQFTNFYNAATLSWNFYLHDWGTFAISPFANAVILATAAPTPATAIEIGTDTIEIAGVGETEGLDVTLTPSGATTEVDYHSSNEDVFTIEKTSETHVTLTATGVGSAVLTAVTDNGLTDSADVVVTAE